MLVVKVIQLTVTLGLTLVYPARSEQECSHGEARLVDQNENDLDGFVEFCDNGIWHTVCGGNGWNTHAANVVCRQLGYLEYGATNIVHQYENAYTGTSGFSEVECQGTEISLIGCTRNNRNNNCLYTNRNGNSFYAYAFTTCLSANCTDGEVRLVGGSTYREGRVEVCVDGRWGTVCGEGWGDTDLEAGLVCRRLGFPREDATFHRYGEGSGPIYTSDCTSSTSDDSDCHWTLNSSCAHRDDTGVRCLTFEDVCTVTDDNTVMTSDTIPTRMTSDTSLTRDTSTKTTTTNISPTATTTSCASPTIITTANSTTNRDDQVSTAALRSTNEALGALTGLLTAALVAVTMGWIVSCVYWWRRVTKSVECTSEEESSEAHSPHPAHSELDNTTDDRLYDKPTLTTPTEFDVLKTNEAYNLVMVSTTNPSYSTVK